MGQYVWLGLGGALGVVARYGLGIWIVRRGGATFPLHALMSNALSLVACAAGMIVASRR